MRSKGSTMGWPIQASPKIQIAYPIKWLTPKSLSHIRIQSHCSVNLCFSLSTNPWRKHMLLSINLINSNALLCFLGSRKSCPSATCLWAGSVRWVLKAAFVNVNFCKYRERKNPKELRRFAYLGDYYLCIHHLGGSFFLTDKLSLCSAVYQADMQTV